MALHKNITGCPTNKLPYYQVDQSEYMSPNVGSGPTYSCTQHGVGQYGGGIDHSTLTNYILTIRCFYVRKNQALAATSAHNAQRSI